MPFTIRDIPAAMRLNGWSVGAALMDRWFVGPQRGMTAGNKANLAAWPDAETRLVTMQWALRFSRVAEARQRLLQTWHLPPRAAPTAAVVVERLRAAGIGGTGKRAVCFGDLALSSRTLDTRWQVNREVLESSIFAAIDDFYCAMGNALLMLAVAGEAEPLGGGRWRIRIDEVGTYIRDSYDFFGRQMLGAWGPAGISRVAVLAPVVPIVAEEEHSDGKGRYFSVNNDSFRAYRTHYKRGGDFAIFSDVLRTRLPHPIVFEVTL